MEPREYDIELPRGDTLPLSFTLTDANGDALDLSNAEIYFTVKKSYNSSSFVFQKKKTTGGITVTGTTIATTISHTDTGSLAYGDYVYDFELKSGDYVKTLIKGKLTLTDESTWVANE